MRRFSIHSPLCYVPPSGQPVQPEAQPARLEARPARPDAKPASQPCLRLQAWMVGPQAWLDGPEGGTDGQMYRKSPHSTGLCPLSGLLPKKAKNRHLYHNNLQRIAPVSQTAKPLSVVPKRGFRDPSFGMLPFFFEIFVPVTSDWHSSAEH